MKIAHKLPPEGIYQRAKELWGIDFVDTVFTYEDTIYCAAPPSDELTEHEKVHAKQQGAYLGGAKAWWKRYFKDDKFRLDQELKAYRRQYNWMRNQLKYRFAQKRLLAHYCRGLATLYGNLVTMQEAHDLITGTKH